ncbi:phosphate signaling complex protein PhoU [Caryophanon tenue]|uniref:Phosphate-specific transport system accessory protein PhoU n=1 Tax=Caryophanon tenue TaxID=33978 RepID=A0A1C0YN56_9BACL|nr:phosphate signaling complex protein PhoU [Caryophanon tenue]OCS88583.1 phosphate transport system regulatory protein PhoU [Caryophanon tenue]
MNVRERFELALMGIQHQLTELSELSISALEMACQALRTRDLNLALSVIEEDMHINRLEEMINDQAILLITKQQPVSKDLRQLMVIIKAASDMERVADYAVDIAKETIRIGENSPHIDLKNIEEMCHKTIQMLRSSMNAFVARDMIKAKEVAELDDQVDELYGKTVRELLQQSVNESSHIKVVSHLMFIARFLERCADHSTNICEHLFYLVKGEHYELNS